MICAHYSEPLLRDTRRCECSWTCVFSTFHRLKVEFSGTSYGLIVSCGNFQCGFLNLIPVPHHKHVAWGRQGGHALNFCFFFHNPLLLRNFISLFSRSGWAVAVSGFWQSKINCEPGLNAVGCGRMMVRSVPGTPE